MGGEGERGGGRGGRGTERKKEGGRGGGGRGERRGMDGGGQGRDFRERGLTYPVSPVSFLDLLFMYKHPRDCVPDTQRPA